MDHRQGHGLAKGEKVQGALGLGAPVVLGRHGHRAQAVAFQPGRRRPRTRNGATALGGWGGRGGRHRQLALGPIIGKPVIAKTIIGNR